MRKKLFFTFIAIMFMSIIVWIIFLLVPSDSSKSISGWAIKSNVEERDSEWVETLQLNGIEKQGYEQFGASVDIDGSRRIVGAEGSAYVYHNEDDQLLEYRLLPSDLESEDSYGLNVAIDGDYVAVSAHRSDDQGSNSGSVYIFRWNGIRWNEVAKLLPEDGDSWDYFGSSIALSGNTVMVGSLDDDLGNNSGSVYVYEYAGLDDKGDDKWIEVMKLTASDGSSNDLFGVNSNIDLLDDLAVIGARGHEEGEMSNVEIGAAYIFKRDNGIWKEEQMLLANDGEFYDQFSKNAVAISNEKKRIIIGSFNRGSSGLLDGFGVAYIFRYDSSTERWEEEQRLIANNGALGDSYGLAVDIQGDTVIVGAPQNQNDEKNQGGKVYVYRFENEEWVEVQEFESIVDKTLGFGSVVSLYERTTLIGNSLGQSWIYNDCVKEVDCPAIEFNPKYVKGFPFGDVLSIKNYPEPEMKTQLKTKKLQINIDQEKLNYDNQKWLYNNNFQFSSESYDAFGQLINTGNSLLYILRSARTHHLEGKIAKWSFDPANNKWNYDDVIYDSEYDDRGGKGGLINEKIYIFITRRERTQTIDLGYIFSDDGGETWSDFNRLKIDSEFISFAPYGHIIDSNIEGLFYMPYYGVTKDGKWVLKLLKSENFGENWEQGPIMYTSENSEEAFAEPTVEHIGNGNMITLIRKNDAEGGNLMQITSLDNGNSWGKMEQTNLGGNYGIKVPFTYYDKETDKIIVIYMDRRKNEEPDELLKISLGNPAEVFRDPQKWGEVNVIDDEYFSNCCGYPSLVKVNRNLYYFMHSKEIDKNKADMWGGFIYLK